LISDPHLTIAVTIGLSCFAMIAAVPPALADESLTADQCFVRALQEEIDAKHEAAIAYYDQVIRKNPQFWKAYGNRGAARFNLHDYQGALIDFETAIAHLPPNAGLNDLRKRAQEALAANSPRASENTEDFRRRANQMLLNAQLGGDFADPSTLIMMQAQRRGLIPNTNPIVPMRRAEPIAQPSSIGENRSPFTVAVDREPELAIVQSKQSESPFSTAPSRPETDAVPSGSVATAAKSEIKSISDLGSHGGQTAQYYFDRGCNKTGAMDFVGAIKEYDQAIKLDPNFGKAYANRGSARFNTLDYQGALDDFDTAVRLLPDNPAVKALRDQIAKVLNK